jgi:type II secretory pathway component PulF
MPLFNYIVKDTNGKTKNDIIEALNEESLIDKLQADGYFILSIKPAIDKTQSHFKKTAKATKFTRNKVTLEDLLIFSRQLATMLEAGVTLLRSLDVIAAQIQSKQLATVVKEVRDDIEQGKSLSSSLGKHPKVFNQFWVSLAEVGEASGTMPSVLNKLAEYTEQQAAFKSTIVSAMVYPIILFFVCIGAIAFFALFVAPRFESIFASMKLELPLITKVLLAFFKFVKGNFILIIASMVGGIYVLKQYVKTSAGRMMYETMMFSLPTVGTIYKLIIVDRFTSQMAILVDSGVPILYALEITEKLVSNKTCGIVIAQVREGVREGKSLAEPMQESDFFPSMAVQMIKVGEETGELGKMLGHVSAFYQSNVAAFMKRIGTLIEPFMLIFMGGVIGTIVIAMFMPMFNLTGN